MASENETTVDILNGPNLKALGARQNDIYGKQSIKTVKINCLNFVKNTGIRILGFYTTNSEKELIDKVHSSSARWIIINPGAYTHYNYALYDALITVRDRKNVIEVHITNIHARENFRSKLVTTKAVMASITGFGSNSYILALEGIRLSLSDKLN